MTEFDLGSLWPSFATLVHGETLTPAGLSALFVMITIVCFLVFLFLTGYQLFQARRQYSFYRKLVNGKQASELVASRRDILSEASATERKNKWHELWNEFDETLVEVGDQLKNTSEASIFFNASTLAGGLVGNRLLAAGTGIITGLGVLGTFVGLQLGLKSLVFDSGTDTLMQGIQQLVGGASIAFITSVWGVLLSLIYNLIEKWFEHHVRNRISRLQAQIDELFQRFSPSEILRDIRDDGHESRIVLQGLAERIGNSMQEAVRTMSGSIQHGLEESMRNVLTPAVDKLVASSEAMSSRQAQGSEEALRTLIEEFVEKVGKEGNEQRVALNGASSDVRTALQDMSVGLTGFLDTLERQQAGLCDEQDKRNQTLQGNFSAAIEQQKKMVEHVQSLFEDQTKATGSLIEQGQSLGVNVQQANQSMDKISEHMVRVTQNLEIASGHLENTSDTLGVAIVDASERVRQSSTVADRFIGENARMESNINRVMESLEMIKQGVERSTEQMDNAAGKAKEGYALVSRSYEELQAGIEGHVQQLEEQLAKLLREYGEMVNSQTRERMGQWDKHTQNYTETMTQAISTIADVVEEIELKVQRR
ncbi:MAG: anti-phage defense ZorAB system ZorA [Proteobacteria bacterium]|nr:anti-phage defense ZorAB system ZorA [Pseudomonadota bacterium]